MIKHAIRQAERSTFYRARIGAVVVRGGRILGRGYNRIRYYHESRHIIHKHKESLHAEVDAIINSPCNLRGATMYVARLRKDGGLALAKPCKYCAELINKCGIKRVIYTTDLGEMNYG